MLANTCSLAKIRLPGYLATYASEVVLEIVADLKSQDSQGSQAGQVFRIDHIRSDHRGLESWEGFCSRI